MELYTKVRCRNMTAELPVTFGWEGFDFIFGKALRPMNSFEPILLTKIEKTYTVKSKEEERGMTC